MPKRRGPAELLDRLEETDGQRFLDALDAQREQAGAPYSKAWNECRRSQMVMLTDRYGWEEDVVAKALHCTRSTVRNALARNGELPVAAAQPERGLLTELARSGDRDTGDAVSGAVRDSVAPSPGAEPVVELDAVSAVDGDTAGDGGASTEVPDDPDVVTGTPPADGRVTVQVTVTGAATDVQMLVGRLARLLDLA